MDHLATRLARPSAGLAAVALVVLLLLPGAIGAPRPAASHVSTNGVDRTGVVAARAVSAARLSAALGHGPGAIPVPASPRPSAGPNASLSLEMAYDATDGYVVAVTPNVTGGVHNATYGPNEFTWSFSGGNWTLLNTTGAPPELIFPGVVYDAADSYVVLFGGIVMVGTQGALTGMAYSNQTWTYAGGVWTNRTSAATVQPPPDSPPQITYDAADSYVLLLDQATWNYRAGTWTNVSGSAAVPLPIGGVMAYDAADGYVVYFGGIVGGPGVENWTTINTTWEYSAGNWTNVTASTHGAPGGRIFAAITYDPSLGEVVVFGGSVWNGPLNYSLANDTWAYAGGNWTNLHLSTPGTTWYRLDLTYDGAGHQLVLAGQTNNTTNPALVTSVWLLTTGNWTAAAPVMFLATSAADVGTPFDLSVVVGPHDGALDYRYSGLPTGCASANAPSLRCTASAPGRYQVHVAVTDGAGFAVNLSTVVVVNPAPEVVSFTSSLPIAEVGVPVRLTAVANGGTGPTTFAYSGLPAGCTSANVATIPCTPSAAGTSQVSVTATDALGVTGQLGLTVPVSARPAVTTFVVEPAVVDAGETVVLAALTSGGVGPLDYAFGGLPSGCASSDALSIACAPASPGSYELTFAATDSYGSVAAGSSPLAVNPIPAIASFSVSTDRAEVGQTLDFAVSTAGGTAPYSFVYLGLPGGCVSTDAATVRCVAAVAGNYSVTVVATDATGASTSRALPLSVVAPSTPSPHHPSPLPLSGSGSDPGAFWWGVAVGSAGLIAAALWARRQARVRREGESLVAGLHGNATGGSEQPAPTDLGWGPDRSGKR